MPSESIGRGFDLVAGVYDLAVQLVFRNRIAQLQQLTLKALGKQRSILIVGGGTGLILQQCLSVNQPDSVTYVELSKRMLNRAKRRLSPMQLAKVRFLHGDLSQVARPFDAIVFPFVLDCYPPDQIASMLRHSKQLLSPNGQVVLIDFNEEPGTHYKSYAWKQWFIKILYRFFRTVSSIPASRLAPFQMLFAQAGFTKCSEAYDYQGWLQGVVWKLDAENVINA